MRQPSRFLVILFVMSFTVNTPGLSQGYQLTGTFSGLPDGTWLYLRSHQTIDSCQVIKSSFRMRGRIPHQAVQVLLHTPKFTHYVPFWLENSRIHMSIDAGQSRKGILTSITGSVTEAESKQFAGWCVPIDRQIDSLNRSLDSTQDKVTRKQLQSQRQQLSEQRKQLTIAWIKAHPASLIAANLVSIYAMSWGKAITQSLYNDLREPAKASPYGLEVHDYLMLNKEVKIGDHYTDFEQLNVAGVPLKLSSVKGKYVLLDFWASWCGPCLEENNLLKDTYHRYQAKGFAILGVSLDDNKADWLKAVASGKLTWDNVTDLRGAKNRAALLYGISGIPDNFLIDSNGIIIARNLRGKKLDETLRQLLP